MEYIKLKHQVAELQKELLDWQRKMEVISGKAAMSLRGSARTSFTKRTAA